MTRVPDPDHRRYLIQLTPMEVTGLVGVLDGEDTRPAARPGVLASLRAPSPRAFWGNIWPNSGTLGRYCLASKELLGRQEE